MTDTEAAQICEYVTLWRAQLDKLRSRLTGLTIEQETRVQ